MQKLIGRVSIGGDRNFEYDEYDDVRHGDEHERYENRNKLLRRDDDDSSDCQLDDSKCDDHCLLQYCDK